ncbi:MAG: phosphatidate cytidylyltransferase, partial [Flavobacteriales bacterium]|nr:phosphatidate cytidylyltransferase [Flavobacteriales bacterium]
MEKLISSIDLNAQIQWVIAIILSILVIATTTFWIWNKLNPSKLVDEMTLRTRSWWGMCFIFLFASTVHPIITYIGLAFLSFFTLREVYTLLKLRDADRSTLVACYLSIPIQYYLAYQVAHQVPYQGWYIMFLIFIPVFMFIIIPFLLVLSGDTNDIIRSMCVLPTSLMLGVFGISHLALLISFPEMNDGNISGKAL